MKFKSDWRKLSDKKNKAKKTDQQIVCAQSGNVGEINWRVLFCTPGVELAFAAFVTSGKRGEAGWINARRENVTRENILLSRESSSCHFYSAQARVKTRLLSTSQESYIRRDNQISLVSIFMTPLLQLLGVKILHATFYYSHRSSLRLHEKMSNGKINGTNYIF